MNYVKVIIMPKITLTFDAWECAKCHYKWKSKTEEKPLRCPDCGSCLWDTPKKEEAEDATNSHI